MPDGSRRVFVAGASGVIGVRLVPLLIGAGHRVAGLTRTQAHAERLARLGAEPIVANALEREALVRAMRTFAPDVVMHQLTDLPDREADLASRLAAHARLLREGTRNLLDGAGDAHVTAQSVAWPVDGDAGRAYADLEATVLGAGGGIVRFGQFYGPGTYHESGPPDPPRIHVDAAARRAFDEINAVGVVIATDPE